MLKDFELAAKRHEEIQKVAFASMVAKPLLAAAKWAVKNPLKALGGAATGLSLATDTKDFTNAVRGASSVVPRAFKAGPTF